MGLLENEKIQNKSIRLTLEAVKKLPFAAAASKRLPLTLA
jgi:hypothetical protein